MAEEETIVMLDLEQALINDTSGEHKASLVSQLEAESGTLKRGMDAGLAPDDFAVAEKFQEALKTASRVVRLFHAASHAKA